MLFKETIRRPAEAEGKWAHSAGSNPEYGHVQMRLEPLSRGSGIQLAPFDGWCFPITYFPGVEQGLMSALASGPLGRYEVTDLRAAVISGSYHEQDSSIHAFAKATEDAVRKALKSADPLLLEPVVRVSVQVPEILMGVVIGEINGCHGRISSVAQTGGPSEPKQTITALIAERELKKLELGLASSTGGKGSVSSVPGGFEELPAAIASQMRYCPGCERKVLPHGPKAVCPDCDTPLASGDDFIEAV